MEMTIKCREVLERSIEISEQNNNTAIEPVHIIYSALSNSESVVSSIINLVNGSTDNLKTKIKYEIDKLPKGYGDFERTLSRESANLLKKSENQASKLGDSYLSNEHLLLGIFDIKNRVQQILKDAGISKDNILNALKEIRGNSSVHSDSPEQTYEVLKKYTNDLTAAAERGKLDPVIGRDSEIRRVMQVLSRRTKNNPVLIGEPGVGKTAIAEGLAIRIVEKDVPDSLMDKKVMVLDIASLVAGAKFRGEFEERFKAVIKEVGESNGNIILFIDELHTLMGAGAVEGSNDASNMLKPALARGELRAIGATTLNEYRKYIEKDSAFERRFQPVYTDEPSVEDTITILRGIKEKYEIHHGVRINDEAIIQAAVLSDRYITSRFLPDKAIDLMDEAASRLKIEIESQPEVLDKLEREILTLEIEKRSLVKDKSAKEKLEVLEKNIGELSSRRDSIKGAWLLEKRGIDEIREIKTKLDMLHNLESKYEREGNLEEASKLRYSEIPALKDSLTIKTEELESQDKSATLITEEVGEEEIADVISIWTGIPVSKLLKTEAEKYLDLENHLKKRVIGQENALEVVSDAIRRNKTGLSDNKRPLGTFLFMGPSGVGKTELSKTLAEFLFNDEKSITRIDMSEYMEKHSVSRLIGAPPGYIGYDEGGQLTEAVRRRPYSVILFDEIEKAHPAVFNTMLQIFDDGRLTDGQGRIVDFTNSIIIMTSNIGSSYILDINLSESEIENRISTLLKDNFKPEFLNRIDEKVIFNRLDSDKIIRIVDMELEHLKDHLKERKLNITISQDVKTFLGREGFDPVLGARPVKRAIQKLLLNPLSKELLKNRYKEGDIISVYLENDIIAFK